MFCRSFFVLFLLAIVMSVLRFTDSDYPFGTFKLFLCQLNNLSVISWWKKVVFLLTIAQFDSVASDLELRYRDIFFLLNSIIYQNKYSSPPLIKPLQPNANPSFQAKFQLHWDGKMLLNCPPHIRPHFFCKRNDGLIREGLLYIYSDFIFVQLRILGWNLINLLNLVTFKCLPHARILISISIKSTKLSSSRDTTSLRRPYFHCRREWSYKRGTGVCLKLFHL